MAKWAIVHGGRVVEVLTGGDAPQRHPDLSVIDATAAADVRVGWLFQGGALVAPTPAPRQWSDQVAQARALLQASDVTILRCFEASIAVPPSWVAYRAALRAIVSAPTGDPSAALPVRPAFPA